MVKVIPAGSRGRSISGRGSVGDGEKSRATERALSGHHQLLHGGLREEGA
jgi:hypothetical protein